MLLFCCAVGVGLGFRAPHPAHRRAPLQIRWGWAPVVAAFAQILLGIGRLRHALGSMRFGVIVFSYLLVGVWLAVITVRQARAQRGPLTLVTGGWLCNVVPLIANGGMPVSGSALRTIGGRLTHLGDGNLYKHVLANSHTTFAWLGDVVPVPLPIVRNVISAGDLLIMLGAFLAIWRLGEGQTSTHSNNKPGWLPLGLADTSMAGKVNWHIGADQLPPTRTTVSALRPPSLAYKELHAHRPSVF